jgi:hypothetical protein
VGDDALSNLVAGKQCLFDRVKLADNNLLVDRSVKYCAVPALEQHAGNNRI